MNLSLIEIPGAPDYLTRRINIMTSEERRQLREGALERRLRAGLLDPETADAAMDELVRRSIRIHGA